MSCEPVFCADSGAVAGVTSGDGVVYWYGEIAGYYLAYLASLMVETSKKQRFAKHAARQVGLWIRECWTSEIATTRIYTGKSADWRNDYIFAFDLAMILKGLASARACGVDAWRGRQISEFIKSEFIDERGSLRAVIARTSNQPPDTWSTGIDGHQLKSAAGLIAWGKHSNDRTMYRLGQSTLQSLTRGGICDWPHLPLHPRLYALEGVLLCGLAKPGLMAPVLTSILISIDIVTERTDVIAQLLRLALFAQMEGLLVDTLALHLLDSIDADGSVVFRVNQIDEERNTWCAIFARQALHFYNEAICGRKVQSGLCI
ncbi:MAG: hypothetical protein QNK24_04145 [Desulfuromusa sp.]|nr:hypothetical protein [Desulfuromusa sp.]